MARVRSTTLQICLSMSKGHGFLMLIQLFLIPAGLTQFGNARNVNPIDVVKVATHDTNSTLLRTISTNYGFTRERVLSASLDFDTPLYLSDVISAVIKFGGKYQYQKRSNDINLTNGEAFGFASGGAIISQLEAAFPWFS